MIINFQKQYVLILFRENKLFYGTYMGKTVKMSPCMKFEMFKFKFTLSQFGGLPFKQGHGSCRPPEGSFEIFF